MSDTRMRLAFTLSTINPYTGKRLREWCKEGINGFIAECYTPKNANSNRFLADHYIAWCKVCEGSHSIIGLGNTPTAAYNDCKHDLDNFICEGRNVGSDNRVKKCSED